MLRSAFLALASVVLLSCGSGNAAPNSSPSTAPTTGWTLSWSDEFNGTDGSAVDTSKWVAETGGNGFGNQELESYTARPVNAHIEGNALAIVAQQETYTGADGIQRNYTSARLKTASTFSQRYGRFEARLQLPRGQGIWPAFWLLGDNIGSVGWPQSGEIDIMESLGHDSTTAYGTIHGPGYSGAQGIQSKYVLPAGQQFADGYHTFAIEWEPDQIRFYVDNTLYGTRTPADLPKGATWVYDHPFFIILNVAVGGAWPGNPDKTTVFPQKMLVDYVRVYTKAG